MSLKKTKEYPKIDTHEFTISESINGSTPLNCDVTTLKRILLYQIQQNDTISY